MGSLHPKYDVIMTKKKSEDIFNDFLGEVFVVSTVTIMFCYAHFGAMASNADRKTILYNDHVANHSFNKK